jgi:hypothetical protein
MQRLDTTIAFKIIALSAELSGSEKRVAGAIIDHFNHKTTQCDPSLDRIACLLGVNRRTVIRAIDHLQKLRLLRRDRHGGHFNRNSYEPMWAGFRQIEKAWKVRFAENSKRLRPEKLSPSQGQSCQPDGGGSAPQTLRSNQSKETYPVVSAQTGLESPNPDETKKQPAKGSGNQSRQENLAPVFSRKRCTPSRQAAYSAAERRWHADLHDRYGTRADIYGAVIEAIDSAMQSDATEAELRKHGAGLGYIVDQLRVRAPFLSAANTEATEASVVAKPTERGSSR